MIAGLEFLKSRRFWTELVVVMSAINLASAGLHIALNLYLPVMDIEPHDIYSKLGGFVVAMLTVGLYLFVYRRAEKVIPCPEEGELRFRLVSGLAAVAVSLIIWMAVHWLIVKPILPNAPEGSVYPSGSNVLLVFFGWWIAGREWAAMTGAGSERKRSVIPDSP